MSTEFNSSDAKPAISVQNLSKVYDSGHTALQDINLTVNKGEIFALLGPNGAGKTTLISIICGLVTPGSGHVYVDGHDIVQHYRPARQKIGLVPQELSTASFEKVLSNVRFSRGLFGKAPDPEYLEQLLRNLSLWDKRHAKIITLSGGMKRRLLIAKALSHQPDILFLDEPTAGVDVELRRDMWRMVKALRQQGVTIVLTTHYLEEAEEMADRIGVINQGKIIMIDQKSNLMQKLGEKQLIVTLHQPVHAVPDALSHLSLELSDDGLTVTLRYQDQPAGNHIPDLLRQLEQGGLSIKDLQTRESSLEDIFVKLVYQDKGEV